MISFCTGQSGQHAHTTRALDFYSTPAIAVEALLQAEQFTPATRVWEPAAGDGAITHVLRVHGFPVICSDIVERAFPLHFTGDFLTQSKAPEAVTTIVTNPPFRQAQRFAEHSINLVPDVFLLLRLAFLESVRRTDLLEHRGLCAVHISGAACLECIDTAGTVGAPRAPSRSLGFTGAPASVARPSSTASKGVSA
jgi:hypothetical protein